MKIKYTKDGRKVMMIPEINQSETIVNNFVVNELFDEVNELFDERVKSYKEKNLADLEARYDRELKDWHQKIQAQEKVLKAEYNKVYLLTKSVQRMGAQLSGNNGMEFCRLLDFMSGRITHLLVGNWYGTPEIIEFDKYSMVDTFHHDNIKLITLFGDVKTGTLNYAISQYSDGSGSTTRIIPCTSHDEAVAEFGKYIAGQSKYSDADIRAIDKYGLPADPDKLAEYQNSKAEATNKAIKEKQDAIARFEREIEALKSNNSSPLKA